MATGCVHLHIQDGEIINVFCHLSDLPEEGVIHLKVDKILSLQSFLDSHPMDKNEISVKEFGQIYNLGPNSI